jgi:copper chaperone CopZ
METMKFKTTIKCAGCVEKVTPALNRIAGTENWKVDIQAPDKILTITPEESVQAGDVIKAMNELGYKAEKLDE